MRQKGRSLSCTRLLLLGAVVFAGGPQIAVSQENPPAAEPPSVNLLEGLRDGRLAARAEGRGDGRMTLSITNQSPSRLRVVLPPGLVASGASGQFGAGGAGGPGGGFGGQMGGGGGQMGGGGFNGGGFGGQNGGFGNNGMGMGAGGMGGMGRGGVGRSGVLPASIGMLNVGRLIMSLTGPAESWDRRSLFQNGMGMGMGMGGNGMGGNGMGGVNGGNFGGNGNGFGPGRGFRSMAPVGPPSAVVEPGRTRQLATSLVSLCAPGVDGEVTLPADGEELTLRDIQADPRYSPQVRLALMHLAQAQAPETVAQLVLWHVAAGVDWTTLARISRRWANASEIALARDIAGRFESQAAATESPEGRLVIEILSDAEHNALAGSLRSTLEEQPIFGLRVRSGIPAQPTCPSIACRTKIAGTEASVQLWLSDPAGKWVSAGKFTMPITNNPDLKAATASLTDTWAEGVLSRLIRVQLAISAKTKGKDTYKIRIDNVSSLVLHGLVLSGTTVSDRDKPSAVAGLSLPPKKTLTVPATSEVVERLGFKSGVRVLAASLTGL